MTAGVKRQIARLSRIVPGETDGQKREAAIGSWAAMVGAMILARVSDDPMLSAEILEQTRSWLAKRAEDQGGLLPKRRSGSSTAVADAATLPPRSGTTRF